MPAAPRSRPEAPRVLARLGPCRDDIREVLRINVIVARAHARMSQEELALRSGVSRPTISRLERGAVNVGIDKIARIADALGVTPAELLAPHRDVVVNDSDIEALAAESDPADFTSLEDFEAAIAEADGVPRYSKAGRPVARRASH